MNKAIVWFRQDLRLHDNEALMEAIRNADEVLPVYIFDVKPDRIGLIRARFLVESVADLQRSLKTLGSNLFVRIGDPVEILYQLAIDTKCQWVYCNRERTREEVDVQDRLEKRLWTIGRELRYTRGKMLFHTADLPFPVTQCPDSFAIFRKAVEHIVSIRRPLELPDKIPPTPTALDFGVIPFAVAISTITLGKVDHNFIGGESAGLQTLSQPVAKETSSLYMGDGRVLSPWISFGCLSPKKVYYASFEMEGEGERIRSNLMYRDYLRLMAKKYGDRIFYASGVYGRKIALEKDQETIAMWESGNTGISIIDAAMHQLNQTGWIPEVLRKLVAGYLVRALRQDWKSGASWFEYALIDYDPCSNWVSWQNAAGIGPDSKEDRTIHYDTAGRKLDPDGSYVMTWNGKE